MAGELKVTVAAALAKGFHKEKFEPGQISIDQSGAGAWSAVVSVGTSEEDILQTDITTLGWMFLQNLDPTNYVTWGAKDTTMKAVGRIKPGEVVCLRLEPGITLRWIANTAACKVKILLLEA